MVGDYNDRNLLAGYNNHSIVHHVSRVMFAFILFFTLSHTIVFWFGLNQLSPVTRMIPRCLTCWKVLVYPCTLLSLYTFIPVHFYPYTCAVVITNTKKSTSIIECCENSKYQSQPVGQFHVITVAVIYFSDGVGHGHRKEDRSRSGTDGSSGATSSPLDFLVDLSISCPFITALTLLMSTFYI